MRNARRECIGRIEAALPFSEWLELPVVLSSSANIAVLESTDPTGYIGHWSFLCLNPFAVIEVRDAAVRKLVGDESVDLLLNDECDDPWRVVTNIFGALNFAEEEAGKGSPPFRGGWIGGITFEAGRTLQPRGLKRASDTNLPDAWFAEYAGCAAYDHQSGAASFWRTSSPDIPAETTAWLDDLMAELGGRDVAPLRGAERELDKHKTPSQGSELLRSATDPASPRRVSKREVGANSDSSKHVCRERFESSLNRQRWNKAVDAAQDYLRAGDIYQVNLTRRIQAGFSGDPLDLWRRLRQHNPAPFSALIDAGDFALLSSSPERFLRYDAESRMIETRPIKGTRPRGDTVEEETRLEAELMGLEKEAAELLMILDLQRNDLGAICELGSVEVIEARALEKYATVMHTVSTVRGKVREGLELDEILRATFPGGSITGAPKSRACEIIEELEPVPRGFYTGAIGYIDFGGIFDFNVAIRTITLKEGKAYLGVGGGITIDSDPAAEWAETEHKALGMLRALGITDG